MYNDVEWNFLKYYNICNFIEDIAGVISYWYHSEVEYFPKTSRPKRFIPYTVAIYTYFFKDWQFLFTFSYRTSVKFMTDIIAESLLKTKKNAACYVTLRNQKVLCPKKVLVLEN